MKTKTIFESNNYRLTLKESDEGGQTLEIIYKNSGVINTLEFPDNPFNFEEINLNNADEFIKYQKDEIHNLKMQKECLNGELDYMLCILRDAQQALENSVNGTPNHFFANTVLATIRNTLTSYS